MNKVLVTGGAGFLGSHIADALTARGREVVLFDRNASRYRKDGQSMIVADLLDTAALASAMQGVSEVFHLAGLADLNRARDLPLDTVHLNIVGTLNVLEAARAAGVKRFMFASTVYVYSREGGFYRCSKQAAEAYIEEFHRQYQMEYTILRFGSLYGRRTDRTNGVLRLLDEAVTSGKIRYVGSPEDTREYIHVEDAANLSVDALAEQFANEHIVITGHHPTRIGDLFTMFSEILGREVDVEYVAADHGHYRITPYTFTPKVGRKLTSSYYVDMGQGMLDLLNDLHAQSATTHSVPQPRGST